MAKYEAIRYTSKGIDLINKALAGEKLEFTKFAISDSLHDNEDKIDCIMAEFPVTSFFIDERSQLHIRGACSNVNIMVGFYVRCIDIYAKDADEDVLIGYIKADPADYICPWDKCKGITSFDVDIALKIDNADTLDIIVNDEAYAPKRDLLDLENEVDKKVSTQENGVYMPMDLVFKVTGKLEKEIS